MYPYIHIVVSSYALFTIVGTLVVLIFLYFRTEKYGMEFIHYIKAFVFAACALVLGSRILFVITQILDLLKDFSVLRLVSVFIGGGFVYYGGLLGMLAGVYLYISRYTEYNVTNVYNMIAPAIPLFHAFGRFGCFMTGCCYGKELSYPVVINNFIQINRVPTQLLEVLFETIMFWILLLLERNRNRNLLKSYMLSYGIFRFFIEFFRGDAERGYCMGLSTSQWISLLIICGYFFRGFVKRKKSTKHRKEDNHDTDKYNLQ